MHPEARRTSVTDSTPLMAARPPSLTVDTIISASCARNLDTVRNSAPNKSYQDALGARPRYLRYNLWNVDSPLSPTIADWSETAPPLPRPPLSEFSNIAALETIERNPSLFRIITPINVDLFRHLLSEHPNLPFVESVCTGLREGFWPWADTLKEGYPLTHDASRPSPSDPKKAAFIRAQRDIEISKQRFSESFGPDLLPGMYCMPAHAVPKPNSEDLRMVTDHSAGPYSLNSMVNHDLVTGYPLDNMTHMGEMLLENRRSTADTVEMVVWKSDIAEAYRLMPLHPLWQMKQINTVDGLRYVDRNITFGNSGSPTIFISFNSLVAWIAKHVRGIHRLATYIDDSSGFDRSDDLLLYSPYSSPFPHHQTLLLQLWDDLRIPHKRSKQIFGPVIPIIGIDVDPNAMTLSLSPARRSDLCDALQSWAFKPTNRTKPHYQLKHWQQIGGWINWALNVYPLLCPCLNNFYAKLSGSHDPSRKIWVNNAVRDDLAWAACHIEASDGVHLLRSANWDLSSADVIVYCDACLDGMGFWYLSSLLGFYSPTPLDALDFPIFYFEALCVLCALQDVSSRVNCRSRVIIYTDNLNTVQIFNTLGCLPSYNHILRRSVDLLLSTGIDLRVLHVPGEQNSVADALSRCNFEKALFLASGLKISPFQPPRWTLGATQK